MKSCLQKTSKVMQINRIDLNLILQINLISSRLYLCVDIWLKFNDCIILSESNCYHLTAFITACKYLSEP